MRQPSPPFAKGFLDATYSDGNLFVDTSSRIPNILAVVHM